MHRKVVAVVVVLVAVLVGVAGHDINGCPVAQGKLNIHQGK